MLIISLTFKKTKFCSNAQCHMNTLCMKKDIKHSNEVIKIKRRANQQSTKCRDGGKIKSISRLMIASKTKDCVKCENYEATQSPPQ